MVIGQNYAVKSSFFLAVLISLKSLFTFAFCLLNCDFNSMHSQIYK